VKIIQFVALCVFTLSICACTPSVQSVRTDPNIRLREYTKLYLVLAGSTGSTSVSGGVAGNLGSAQVMDGTGQATLALTSLQFDLASLGFQVVADRYQAELVGEFSIGQIRYDPLAGWIADQAMLNLKDASSDAVVAMFRSQSGMITPTVSSLVSQMVKSVKKAY
jgi:hypothetical protein